LLNGEGRVMVRGKGEDNGKGKSKGLVGSSSSWIMLKLFDYGAALMSFGPSVWLSEITLNPRLEEPLILVWNYPRFKK
jgi:hypothetical protein